MTSRVPLFLRVYSISQISMLLIPVQAFTRIRVFWGWPILRSKRSSSRSGRCYSHLISLFFWINWLQDLLTAECKVELLCLGSCSFSGFVMTKSAKVQIQRKTMKGFQLISTDATWVNIGSDYYRSKRVGCIVCYQNGDFMLHGNDNSKYNLFVSWMSFHKRFTIS